MFNKIDKIEQILPHWAIAALAIGLAALFIMYRGQDHTVCDSQKEAFIQAEKKFLASENHQIFFKRCLKSNRSGGCAPYFKGMKILMNHLAGHIESSCVQSVIAKNASIKRALYNFLLEVTRLAWGDKGPTSIYSRNSWLDAHHIRTFCMVKLGFQNYFGMAVYKAVENSIIEKLPDENHHREHFIEKKEKTLLGIPCSQYL